MSSFANLLNFYQDNLQALTAIRLITHTNRSVLITGKEGTSKLKILLQTLRHCQKKHIIFGATERITIEVGGDYLSGFFGLHHSFYAREESEIPTLSQLKIDVLKNTDIIAIVGIENLRPDILHTVDRSLRTHLQSQQPFGGKQIVFCGDLFQKYPIEESHDKEYESKLKANYNSSYFFGAEAFESSFVYDIVELTHSESIGDAQFLHIINSVRVNRFSTNELDLLNSRYVEVPTEKLKLKMTMLSHSGPANNKNDEKFLSLPGEVFHSTAEHDGIFPNEKEALPAPKTLYLKVGAQVVFTTNDPDNNWYRGMLGILKKIEGNALTVEVRNGINKRDVLVKRHQWYKCEYSWNIKDQKIDRTTSFVYVQFPLQLGWYTSIKMSEGSLFENVIFKLDSRSYSYGHFYMALSRCTSLKGIILNKRLSMVDIFSDAAISKFIGTSQVYGIDQDKQYFQIDRSVRSFRQNLRLVNKLEENILQSQHELSDIKAKLIKRNKDYGLIQNKHNQIQRSLKEVEGKLTASISKLATKEESFNSISSKTSRLQIIIVILVLVIAALLFTKL